MKVLSAPAEMLLHKDMGERYLGVSGVLALMLISVFASMYPPEQSGPLYLLIPIFLARIVGHRVCCIRRRIRGGKMLHSRYAGEPLLWIALRGKVPVNLVRWTESILILIAGGAVSSFNKPLGDYLLWTGVGLLGMIAVRANLAYNKLLDTLDAQLENAALAESVRARQQQL
jgi:hypothetical protein